MGQKVYPPGGLMQSSAPAIQQPGMPMNFSQQQAMVAQQNTNMDLLDQRRREQEQRARAQAGAAAGGVSICHRFHFPCSLILAEATTTA